MKLPKFLRFHRNTIRQWLIVAGILTLRFEPTLFAAGVVVAVFGAFARLWCKGFLTQRVALATSGPYAYTRNPFYFANLILDCGIGLMIGRVEVFAPYLVMWFHLHHRRILEEEKTLEESFGEAYRAYKAAVPRLWPSFRPNAYKRLGGFGGFSWSNPNFTSRLDVPRLLVALSYPPLLYVAHRAHDLGTALLKAPTALDLSVAGTWFALFATSLRLYRPLRRKKPAVPGWLASDAGRFGVAVAWISAISWGYLGRFVVPFDLLTLGVAAAVVATILVAAPRFSARHREIIELGVYAVIALLAEQPWSWFLLAPFQALLYADHRLLGTPEAPSSEKEPSRPAQAWSTLAILILGVTVMLAKEIFFEPGLRPGAL